eukprot:1180368-Prorocentrum_minimum.AAC.3
MARTKPLEGTDPPSPFGRLAAMRHRRYCFIASRAKYTEWGRTLSPSHHLLRHRLRGGRQALHNTFYVTACGADVKPLTTPFTRAASSTLPAFLRGGPKNAKDGNGRLSQTTLTVYALAERRRQRGT